MFVYQENIFEDTENTFAKMKRLKVWLQAMFSMEETLSQFSVSWV